MSKVQRFYANRRLSEISVHNGVAYLAGQVPEHTDTDAYAQTQEVLALIDTLLSSLGSHKSNILNAQIFLADMADYAQMNRAWDEWVDADNPPSRATVEARLADPNWKVEIVIQAAV
ncbi:RidA family protein [Necropsobacter massiliensis]|uniref:RidA family protein n=1 Tax=Necropsobacter massiliensis TaxID=1400001 RepID=UPI000595ABC3|nr:RidA family protein [Necropsobacter massiliensis]